MCQFAMRFIVVYFDPAMLAQSDQCLNGHHELRDDATSWCLPSSLVLATDLFASKMSPQVSKSSWHGLSIYSASSVEFNKFYLWTDLSAGVVCILPASEPEMNQNQNLEFNHPTNQVECRHERDCCGHEHEPLLRSHHECELIYTIIMIDHLLLSLSAS